MSPLLFVSVPPLSVSFLFLAAGSVAVTVAISSLLVLAVTIPFFVTAQAAETSYVYNVHMTWMLQQPWKEKSMHTYMYDFNLSSFSGVLLGLTWCSL